jgi:hypothetical protein
LVDLNTNVVIHPIGLITRCIRKKKAIVHNNLTAHEEYSQYVDNLGIAEVKNILLVPIFSGLDAVGAIACANGVFDDEVIKVCKFVSLIVRVVFKTGHSLESRGRRLKILLHWSKQVFLVHINSQHKQELAKQITYSITTNFGYEENISLALDVMRTITNSEGCCLVYKNW